MSINTLDEQFRMDMDNASSIAERLQTLETLHKNGICVVLFMSPIFPELTDWQAIIERSKDYIDEYWFENLNLRGAYKSTILDYISSNYPNYYDIYKNIYIKGNKDYWVKLSNDIEKYCVQSAINHINYFYHKELVEAKINKTK